MEHSQQRAGQGVQQCLEVRPVPAQPLAPRVVRAWAGISLV